DQMFIGREVRCDVMLNNESVSRRHAEVLRLAEGFLLRDLNSRNGTYVNGQRIQEYLLQDGDTVTVGDINMIFEAARRPVPAEPEPVSSLASGLEVEETGTAVTRPSEEGDTEVWRRKRPG
ncbi:MAG TPA: FHA domain-containing protein, partial [Candidatus Nitrosotenuis sp.]|nr:FHA domain-containing protein [Candidatus Nitrosotenuis sp.]